MGQGGSIRVRARVASWKGDSVTEEGILTERGSLSLENEGEGKGRPVGSEVGQGEGCKFDAVNSDCECT